MMDWLINHPQVLIVIALAVAAMLKKFNQARLEQEARKSLATDPEDAERTRRIQAEIRRRIEERRGLTPPSAVPVDKDTPEYPDPPPLIEEVRPVMVEPPLAQMAEANAYADSSSELERQHQILLRLRELETVREASMSSAMGAKVFIGAGGQMPGPANQFLTDLRHPSGLRRAVVLREILGPPVGLC